jgi:hypothetical protein
VQRGVQVGAENAALGTHEAALLVEVADLVHRPELHDDGPLRPDRIDDPRATSVRNQRGARSIRPLHDVGDLRCRARSDYTGRARQARSHPASEQHRGGTISGMPVEIRRMDADPVLAEELSQLLKFRHTRSTIVAIP